MMMGLWVLLFLHLHFGNTPWTEVLCASLPAPSNVSITSFNMEHALTFQPGPKTPPSSLFIVQILHLRRNSWTPVAGCLELMAGQTCNLTTVLEYPFEHYTARVRAFTTTQISNWTVSQQFQPLSDTVLGPPDVSVSGCGNCLLLWISPPATSGPEQQQLLRHLYQGLVFLVRRTRDSVQFTVNVPYKDESVISYLQPGVEYCVTVSVTTVLNSNHISSEPHCAFTSPPSPTSPTYIVYCLLGALCALAIVLIGWLVYSRQLQFLIPRQRQPETLPYFLLQGQNDGGASPELSGPITDKQLCRKSSGGWLLTPPGPDPPTRSSSDEEEAE